MIEVIDRGLGIAPWQLKDIVAPFRRKQQSPPSSGSASGEADSGSGGVVLGLFIARRAADLLGAQLEVQSQVGRGTTFTLSLPPRPPEKA